MNEPRQWKITVEKKIAVKKTFLVTAPNEIAAGREAKKKIQYMAFPKRGKQIDVLSSRKMGKYQCSHCGYDTDTVSIGMIHSGCTECGYPGFRKYGTDATYGMHRFMLSGKLPNE